MRVVGGIYVVKHVRARHEPFVDVNLRHAALGEHVGAVYVRVDVDLRHVAGRRASFDVG